MTHVSSAVTCDQLCERPAADSGPLVRCGPCGARGDRVSLPSPRGSAFPTTSHLPRPVNDLEARAPLARTNGARTAHGYCLLASRANSWTTFHDNCEKLLGIVERYRRVLLFGEWGYRFIRFGDYE